MPIYEEKMKEKVKGNIDKIIGMALFILACFFLVRSFFLSMSTDIWYDELFSMRFANSSVAELVSRTARDVHPPLYYLILKGFLVFFGKGTGVPLEIIAKMVSIVPLILLFIYSMTVIRKRFGLLTAGLFSFMVVSMPALPEYTTEIRMYTWALFFVTAALLHGFNLMRDMLEGKAKWDIGNGFALWFYGTAAAYTHYYAALSVGIIYGIIFIWMLVTYLKNMKDPDHKGKIGAKAFAMLIICGNLTVVSYIPWISALLSQVKQVSGSYWIQPVGLRSFGSVIKYLFSGYFSNSKVTVVLAVIMFLFVAALFVLSFMKFIKEKEIESCEQFFAFLVLPVLVVFGIVVSILMRPVFANRYMIPALGCFYLAIAIGIGEYFKNSAKKVLKISYCLFTVIVVIVGCVDFKAFIGNEEYRQVNMDKTLEFFASLDPDTVIISNFDHVQGLLDYYLNSGAYSEDQYGIYLYYAEPETLVKEMGTGLYTIEDSIDIENYLLSGKKVLFLGSFNSREVLLEEWYNDYGITSENLGSYLMERYWFDVFELSL